MFILRYLITFLACLCFSINSFAQQQYPSTLLWKITGNNLSKPSYLYGTIHVQDRRLFYFGDSLYNAIEKTAGFAMEINPDEMMDSLIKSLQKDDTSALLKKVLDEKEYKKVSKELEKKLNIPADKITMAKLAAEKKRWYTNFTKKDDMSTIMDLYLFTIARKQGKYTGGIEDLADQFNLVNEIGTFKLNDFIKNDSTIQMSNLEKMKQVYLSRDLTQLNNMVNGTQNEFTDIFLIKRNIKMARRIDSLSALRSTVFAVGAAHLPGDKGLIKLLQQKGFTVEPVFSSVYMAPEAYKYNAKEVEWQTVEDENKMCSIKMPGTPSALTVKNVLPMKMYLDLSDLTTYGISVSAVSEEEAKSDSFFTKLVANYKGMGFDIRATKNIEYQNVKGIEMHAIDKTGNYLRNRFLLNKNKIFIIIYGGRTATTFTDPKAEKYFSSLVFNDENIAGKNEWQSFTSEKNGFTMKAPGKIIEGVEKGEEGTANDKYTAINYSDGSYFLLVVRDTKPGFFIENDSLYFAEYKKNLALAGQTVKEFEEVQYDNCKAAHFITEQTENNIDLTLQGYIVRRGNRTYVPMVVSVKLNADYPEVTNFFRSFNLIPLKKGDWKKRSIDHTNFSTSVPDKFIKIKQDTTAYDYDTNEQRYNVRDKNDASSYSVDMEAIPSYYWSTSDSVFFKERMKLYKGENDSLISYHFTDATVKTCDVVIKLKETGNYKKLKLFLNGDTLYTLYTYQDKEGVESNETKSFFDDVVFSRQYPTSIFTNKTVQLLQALKSKDSATVASARLVLDKIKFTKNDLPLLYDAVSKKYKKYDNVYQTINDLLINKIGDTKDTSIISFVGKQYFIKNDSTQDIQMLLLEALATYETTSSYSLLKQLLLNNPPRTGQVYKLINTLTDSIALVKDFFPAVTALYSDSVLGNGMAQIANFLLDSNTVSEAAVLQNESGLLALAKTNYNKMKADKEAYFSYGGEVIALLGKFNSKQSNGLLVSFSTLPDMWIKQDAVIALLKNKQPVPVLEIKKLAADKAMRISIYESLVKIKMQSLFPKEYYTQQKFAEAYIETFLSDEDEVSIKNLQFVKEKIVLVKGKQQRYLLYKAKLEEEDEDTGFHLVICGPFQMNKAIAEIDENESDIFFDDDTLDMKNIDQQFQKHFDKDEAAVEKK